jgi:hypothetical protein
LAQPTSRAKALLAIGSGAYARLRADVAMSKRALARVKKTTAFAEAEAVEQTDRTKRRARRVGFSP